MSGPQTTTRIILVPTPVGASVDWGKTVKPQPYRRESKREAWRPAKAIPAVDHQAIRRRIEEALRQSHAQRADLIQRAKATLGSARIAA
jgi:hypothetical protein